MIIHALRKGLIEPEASVTGEVPRWKSFCPDQLTEAIISRYFSELCWGVWLEEGGAAAGTAVGPSGSRDSLKKRTAVEESPWAGGRISKANFLREVVSLY